MYILLKFDTFYILNWHSSKSSVALILISNLPEISHATEYESPLCHMKIPNWEFQI